MSDDRRGRRHRPEEAERIILAAARAFLEERPFRELTVEGVMSRTGLSRPAFYAYFKDRYDLVTRLLEGVGGLLFAMDRRWLAGGVEGGQEVVREDLAAALQGTLETFVRYGPLLRAISDAASQDPTVEEAYRRRLIGGMIEAVAARIARDIESGNSPGDLNPRETARALVLMTERYLLDAFGDTLGRQSPGKIAVAMETLERVWVQTLYGAEG